MNDHMTIDRGEITSTPKRLRLVASSEWPDQSDTDTHYECEPIDVWSALTLVGLGAFIASVLWFQVGGS